MLRCIFATTMEMKGLYCILLLIASNVFMTIAWYGQLAMKGVKWYDGLPLLAVIALSWGVAFFEYCLQVPGNRIGSAQYGGPFSLVQLKVIQEIITLCVFTMFNIIVFHYQIKLNHVIGFAFLVAAVYCFFLDRQ